MQRVELQIEETFSPRPVAVRQALQKGTEFLSRMGVESARLDAELLLSKALGCTKERLYFNYEMALDAAVKDLYLTLLQRRACREPLAYITGEREFWSLRFHVTPEVLVPRPETELLVEVALELAKSLEKDHPTRILDLGTGSGAIAVSLAKELDDIEVWATDLSARALEVARSNALRHGGSEKIHFIEGDMFCPVTGQHGFFDMVVSNPPYVRQSELRNLAPEVRAWEPKLALVGGSDGLDFYRRIMGEADLYLTERGIVALEIGADMGSDVCRLIANADRYSPASVYQDYAGRDRVVVARKLPSDAIY